MKKMKTSKNVRFNDEVTIIPEPPELYIELLESRKSDFLQRQADKLRYERLLKPVLESKIKRIKYYNKI
jgi:hypothetical protein